MPAYMYIHPFFGALAVALNLGTFAMKVGRCYYSRRLSMNKKLASSIVIALFLLAGCIASGPKLASSAEDIAGTWQSSLTDLRFHFDEDGTYVRERVGDHSHTGLELRFEGTRLIWKDDEECTSLGAETGIYEVELLENGNLKFTVIEDECLQWVNNIAGRLVEVEWEPVP